MARPAALRRFDRYFYQPRISDGALVPITDGTVNFYRQGATLVEETVLGSGVLSGIVHVYHVGAFANIIAPGASGPSNPALVYSADGLQSFSVELFLFTDGTAKFKNLGTGFTFPAGSRSLNSVSPPFAYLDALGTTTTTMATDTSGRAACYLTAYRYDYVVAYASGTKHLTSIDAEGSYVMR